MPAMGRYRLEVLFWGLRDVRPACAPGYQYVALHVGGARLESCRLDPVASLNFQEPFVSLDLELPLEPSLLPAVHVVLLRRAALGLFRRYAATHLLPSAGTLIRPDLPTSAADSTSTAWPWLPVALMGVGTTPAQQPPPPPQPPKPSQSDETTSSESVAIEMTDDGSIAADDEEKRETARKGGFLSRVSRIAPLPQPLRNLRNVAGGAAEGVKMRLSALRGRVTGRDKGGGRGGRAADKDGPRMGDPDPDWWTRYYATVQAAAGESGGGVISRVQEDFLLEIYPSELESQPQFEGFQDFLRVLPLCRGKRGEDSGSDEDPDEDDNPEADELLPRWGRAGKAMAQLKVAMELLPLRAPASPGGCRGRPGGAPPVGGPAGTAAVAAAPRRPSQAPARPLPVVVRVYVVRASALPPRDANGSCDPYLVVRLGRQRRDDVEHCVRQNLNPVFGRVFEFETEFPRDHALTVRVMDWDAAGRNDVIGETRIDLENRVFSSHMGGCGIPRTFSLKGNNRWRDSRLPSEILEQVAADHGLPAPRYEGTSVTLGERTVSAEVPNAAGGESAREHAALAALHAWSADHSLVPQHVETRSLYHPRQPGIEQGQVELWVDVLVRGAGLLPMPPAMALDPPSPSQWELRVVVCEATGVVGTERLLLSKDKASDVYVRGWMSGLERDAQSTDVHFACLSGEALWGWRMLFRFQHVWPEDRVVTEAQGRGRGQGRHPPRLHLALMDYDTFTSDDLLGTLSLDLSRLPRGAAFASSCTAPSSSPGARDPRPTVNLFLARHATGWWPALLAPDVGKPRSRGLGGKLKLELTLLPGSTADHDPAGRGHEGPQALPKPQRPLEAFSMLRHPLLGVYHFVWRRHRRTLLCGVLLFLVAVFVLIAVYSLPGLLVKKVLNA